MTNTRALDALFYTWLAFAVLLVGTVTVQSFNGKYGDDWGIPMQWAIATVAPTLTLVSAAWRNKGKPKWKSSPVSIQHFVVAFGLSVVVWMATSAIIVTEALGTQKIFEIIPLTVAAYSLVQAAIIASVTSIAFANR